MLVRFAVAVLISLVISIVARRGRALSAGGAVAATIVGVLALLAGWSWGVLLIAYFATSSALSRVGAERKHDSTAGVVAKGGQRDATQVLANGGLFAAAALLAIVDPTHVARWSALGAGVLAASASDTWATEIGTLASRPPRSIVTWRPVPAGMSGGITAAGTLAAIAGAAFVAVVILVLGWSVQNALAAFAGGVLGSTLDSLLGATIQARRWCDACGCATERVVHGCNAPTRRSGGLSWMTNDAVNFVSGLAGGLLALLLTG